MWWLLFLLGWSQAQIATYNFLPNSEVTASVVNLNTYRQAWTDIVKQTSDFPGGIPEDDITVNSVTDSDTGNIVVVYDFGGSNTALMSESNFFSTVQDNLHSSTELGKYFADATDTMRMLNNNVNVDATFISTYGADLEVAWADTLGIDSHWVYIATYNSIFNVIQLSSVDTTESQQAFSDSTQLEQDWIENLAQIPSLGTDLGYVWAKDFAISNPSVSGFQFEFEVTTKDFANVEWSLASQELTVEQIKTGSSYDYCAEQSSTLTSGAQNFYQSCPGSSMVGDQVLNIFWHDGVYERTTTVDVTIPTPPIYIPYAYTFLGTTLDTIESDKDDGVITTLQFREAFAHALAVHVDYITVDDGKSTGSSAQYTWTFPMTSHTPVAASGAGFKGTLETALIAANSQFSLYIPTSVSPATGEDIPYISVGGYQYATQQNAQDACQMYGAAYHLCSKAQLYTAVMETVDGWSNPNLCYSGWTSEGHVGWFHDQADTVGETCGGTDGWVSWAPETPGAHCCTDFAAVNYDKDWYFYHPDRYAFASMTEAANACAAYDSDYGLCSRYQLMGLAEDSSLNYDMCVGGYFLDGTTDGNHGFYVGQITSTCADGELGWYQWCDSGLCAAHCCLPSYLDERTTDLYYGSSVDGIGDSTYAAAQNFCSGEQYYADVCTNAELKAVSIAENTNICKVGWVQTDADANAGETGWWQGVENGNNCGAVDVWNKNDAIANPIAHCCAPYAKAYSSDGMDYLVYPTYYSQGYATGDEAVDACIGLGYDGLCTKGQVIWYAENATPNLCRRAWCIDESNGNYLVGYQGYEGCDVDAIWNEGMEPATPVAHCCMSSVSSQSENVVPYQKAGQYVYWRSADAEQECDALEGSYSLCTWAQLYRVAFEDVDGYSDDSLCYTGWLAEGFAGWWQKRDDTCGNVAGWRDWLSGYQYAGAHCCTDFAGSTIPDQYLSSPEPTEAAAPSDCPYILVEDGPATVNGYYAKGVTVNGKYTFTQGSNVISYDNEVWSIAATTGTLVGNFATPEDPYPPGGKQWTWMLQGGGSENYEPVSFTCIDTVYYVGGTASGLVSGQTATLTLTGAGSMTSVLTLTDADTSWTFSELGLANSMTYSVVITTSSDSATCSIENNVGTITAANVNNVAVTCTVESVTVGGEIIGLKSSSVILNSQSDDWPTGAEIYSVSRNGDWQFPSLYSVGATYDVIIAVQPNGQTCTVAQGEGTVTVTVDNIIVTCEDNTYTIGFTVTGLGADAGNVVISLDGAEDLSVSADGSYTFSNLYGFGDNYVVQIASRPEAYACTLTGAYGTVEGNVNDIEVQCVELVGTTYEIEIVFTQIRECVQANAISLSEFSFYDSNLQLIPYTYAASSPASTPSHGNEGLNRLYDSNVQTKWLDYTMGTCGNSLTVYGITLDKEPYYFNFATANDEPNRDPKEFYINIDTMVGAGLVSRRSLYFYLPDLTTNRNEYMADPLSVVSYPVTVTVVNNVGTVIVYNVDNVLGDELTFEESGTKTFLYEIYEGGSYSVSIGQTAESETCVVTGVPTGTITDNVNLVIYCTESCDTPEYNDQLIAAGLPTYLSQDLCVIQDQYYWNGQALCVAAGTVESAACPYDSLVCGGPLGVTYGKYAMQTELLLEAFGASATCENDGEDCIQGFTDCCNPYSECLWEFDASQLSSDNSGFTSKCTPCTDCTSWLNDCDEICTTDVTDPVFHPRCPPSSCTASDTFDPKFFEDEVSYCVSGGVYYMNGMIVCADTTGTTQEQAELLGQYWMFDFEFGTDVCSDNSKSFNLLLQDHIYVTDRYVDEYQNVTTHALENCCLEYEDVNDEISDWDAKIEYMESRLTNYTTNVTASLSSIISQIEAIQSTLESL